MKWVKPIGSKFMVGKEDKKISAELRANFIRVDYPIPFGLLDNCFVDALPYSHKRVMADCFYRAWHFRAHKMGRAELSFNYLERGPFYRKFHYQHRLLVMMDKFENLGFISKILGKNETYLININKFIHQRHYEEK